MRMIIHSQVLREANKGLNWGKEHKRCSQSQMDFPKATSAESHSHRGAAWLGQMWFSSKSQLPAPDVETVTGNACLWSQQLLPAPPFPVSGGRGGSVPVLRWGGLSAWEKQGTPEAVKSRSVSHRPVHIAHCRNRCRDSIWTMEATLQVHSWLRVWGLWEDRGAALNTHRKHIWSLLFLECGFVGKLGAVFVRVPDIYSLITDLRTVKPAWLLHCYFISRFCERNVFCKIQGTACGNYGTIPTMFSWGAGGNEKGHREREREGRNGGMGKGQAKKRRRQRETLFPTALVFVCTLNQGWALQTLRVAFNTTPFLGLNVTVMKRETQDK